MIQTLAENSDLNQGSPFLHQFCFQYFWCKKETLLVQKILGIRNCARRSTGSLAVRPRRPSVTYP